MTSNEILKADVLDILFENRNKLYGAYALRKNYPIQLLKAMLITLVSISALLIFYSTSEKKNVLEDTPPLVYVTPIVESKVIEKKKPFPVVKKSVPAPKISQKKLVAKIKIVENNAPIDIFPAVNELQHSDISTTNTSGKETSSPISGSNTKEDVVIKQNEAPVKEFTAVERQPEFPGGKAAWLAFLNKNLRVPADLDRDEKRTVLVKFQVSTDGTITNFEIQQSGGKLFDDEVIRVLKKMPKWSPAIQNGHHISVYFTQPVTFVGVDN